MKPDFALSLSFDGITLLHRAAGGWLRVGDVSLEATDLTGALGDLRAKALELSPNGIATKLIIPNDQIRYLTVETGGFGGDALHEIVQAALAEATPYDLSEIIYDVSPHGDMSHIAAVARETLAEAEAFAAEHAFNPVCFVAIPGDQAFLGEPYFGETAGAAAQLGTGQIEADGIAVVIVGDVDWPDATPTSQLEAEETATDTLDEGRVGFSSRRITRQITPDQTEPEPQEADDSPPVEEPEPLQVAVTAPVLDVPEAAEEPKKQAVFGSFLSRRKTRATSGAPTPANTAPRKPNPVAAILPDRQVPRNEAARMTVFGARQPDEVGGKPPHLGLILTAALLVFLGAVALWASIFLEEGVAGLFKFGDGKTEIALTPAVVPAPVVQDTDPVLPAIQAETALAPPTVSASTEAAQRGQAATRLNSNALTETDMAVLDALSEPEDKPSDRQSAAPEIALLPPPTDITQGVDTVPDTPVIHDVARYAATGIWPNAPEPPQTPSIIALDDLFVASIDRTDLSHDALALPQMESLDTDIPLRGPNSPVAAGTNFALDDQGLVTPSRDGTLNPDGILVYLGRPKITPSSFPERADPEDELQEIRERLAGLRPKLRPENLAERSERTQLGGLTRAELADVRPRMRPKSVQERATDTEPTAQAVLASLHPDKRPNNIDDIVREALKSEPAPTSEDDNAQVTTATIQPQIPSSASVARQATINNAINLRRVNLIGVYGTPSNRRALIRLPSGRYKKVQVGDRVDGGRVLAIGDGELRYQKSGRNVTLTIPSG